MFALAMEEGPAIDRAHIVEELRACRARLSDVLAELRALEALLSEAQQAPVEGGAIAAPVRLHSVR